MLNSTPLAFPTLTMSSGCARRSLSTDVFRCLLLWVGWLPKRASTCLPPMACTMFPTPSMPFSTLDLLCGDRLLLALARWSLLTTTAKWACMTCTRIRRKKWACSLLLLWCFSAQGEEREAGQRPQAEGTQERKTCYVRNWWACSPDYHFRYRDVRELPQPHPLG